MGKFIFLFLLSISPVMSHTFETTAVSMVPYGKLVENLGRDYTIKTMAGTKISIEFGRDGKLKEASGKNLNKGDELEPGEGLISLSTIAQNVKSSGLIPDGFWLLEKDQKLGWIYEFNGKHLVCAKTGKILNP